MDIPCKKCITLAICKMKINIKCPILNYHYISFLKKHDDDYYKIIIKHIDKYGKFHLYTAFKSSFKYSNTYRYTLKHILPELRFWTIPLKDIEDIIYDYSLY